MRKYYVEIYNNHDDSDFIFQSIWFNTVKEAKDFADKIEYLNSSFKMCIMDAIVDVNGEYDDINLYEILNK